MGCDHCHREDRDARAGELTARADCIAGLVHLRTRDPIGWKLSTTAFKRGYTAKWQEMKG